MAMSDKGMGSYVTKLVRDALCNSGLPDRASWQDVIGALDLPVPLFSELPPDKDGARIGTQIIVNSGVRCVERIEFTVFHEIVHILIEEDGELVSELHDHFFNHDDQNAEKRALELLCNKGAAEFIMPSTDFLPLMNDGNWKTTGIKDVTSKFRCSPVAAAFHYTFNHPKPCAMLICEHGRSPLHPDRDILFAAYSVSNATMRWPMKRFLAIPNSHFIYKVWTDRGDGACETHGFYSSGKQWPMPCEVTCLNDRAYAAFLPTGNVSFHNSTEQLSLF